MPADADKEMIEGLDLWGTFLLRYARSSLPGRGSAFRKFRRRFEGRRFKVLTRHNFRLEGVMGDIVERHTFVFGEYEPGLTRFIKALAPQAGSFLDLGCNIGYFSCLFGAHNQKGRILAIDANPRLVERCRENLRANGISASVLNAAVGAKEDRVVFNAPRDKPSIATLGQLALPSGPQESFEVPLRKLDNILREQGFDSVDLMKADIEGYEVKVFASLPREWASRFRCIVFELHDRNLRQCGFQRSDYSAIGWLDAFKLFSLNEDSGVLRPINSLTDLPEIQATIVLLNRQQPLALP